MMSLTKAGFLAIGIVLAGGGVAPDAALGADPAELSGSWVIDRDASDEPADVLEPATRRRSGRFGGVRAGVSIFGIAVGDVTDLLPDRDSDGEEPQDGARRELDKLRRHVTETVTALEIDETPDALRVAYDDLGTYIYRTGQTVDYEDATVHAEWQRNRYVVERRIHDGPLVTEVFRPDPRENTLRWTVTVKLDSHRDITIDRVFNRKTGT